MNIFDLYARQQVSLMRAADAVTRDAWHRHTDLALADGVRIRAIREAAVPDRGVVAA